MAPRVRFEHPSEAATTTKGGYLIGPADWIGIASSTEPFFELRLPDGQIGRLPRQ